MSNTRSLVDQGTRILRQAGFTYYGYKLTADSIAQKEFESTFISTPTGGKSKPKKRR